MNISKADLTPTGSLDAEQSDLVAAKTNPHLAARQPKQKEANTELEQAAERFKTLLGAQSVSQADAPGPSESPEPTAKTDPECKEGDEHNLIGQIPGLWPLGSGTSLGSASSIQGAAVSQPNLRIADTRTTGASYEEATGSSKVPGLSEPAPDRLAQTLAFAPGAIGGDRQGSSTHESPSTTAQSKPTSQAPDLGPAAHSPFAQQVSTATQSVSEGGQLKPPQTTHSADSQATAAKPVTGTDNSQSAASTQTSTPQDKDNEPARTEDTFPSGDRILYGLVQPNAASQQGAAVDHSAKPRASTAQSDLVGQIEQLGQQLAERILVSERGQVGEPEVRIQLRESVLQGSEIRVHQEQGQLVVSIQTPSADLAHQLSGHTDSLQQTLADRLDRPVRVEVQSAAGASNAGADANAGDGRSRNRRDPWEAYDPNR